MSPIISSIISGEWLTVDRLRVYPRIFLTIYFITIVVLGATSSGKVDMLGKPLGSDFVSFYAAGKLVQSGQAPLVYDTLVHFSAEKSAVGNDTIGYYSFTYPPMILLLVTPLAVFPYLVALLLWQGGSLFFFVSMLFKLSNIKDIVVLALAFPAVLLTMLHGQNSFLTAGLIAGIIYYLDKKPLLCGLMIGLLTLKPHLGILIPVVLLASNHWRVFFAAAGFSLLFAALSYLVLGQETWQAFSSTTDLSMRVLNEGLVPYFKMQSLFASIRQLGGGLMLAYSLHIIFALTAGIVVIYLWRQQANFHVKAAALVVGGLIIPPFLFDYDLTVLGVAITCLTTYGFKQGFRPGLISLLALSWVAPILVRSLNNAIPLPWTAILLSTMLYQMVMIAQETQKTSNQRQKKVSIMP